MAVGWAGFLVLPWYLIEDGFWAFDWIIDGYPFDQDYAPAVVQVFQGTASWLAPIAFFLLLPVMTIGRSRSDPVTSLALFIAGIGGFAWVLGQGFTIGISGWQYEWMDASFGALETRQFGMGYGALMVSAAFLFMTTQAIASRGVLGGDIFVTGSIGLIVCVVVVFIFYPISGVLMSALTDQAGAFSPSSFFAKISDGKIWGLGCFSGRLSCGVAWNSLLLAILVGTGTTLLGLAFALAVTRSRLRATKILRALTILPIITPPFVIGLAIILLFGVSGGVTKLMAQLFEIPESRWIYGLPGIWLAQMLAFTPIAFLVLIGVVDGVSPTLEEAAQTLRAKSWKTFSTVSLPLMKPGLANAFLIGFIESMADFGNPLVLGGNYEVLSTEIFFAIVGAQNDQGMAAVLALVLLSFTLSAFFVQRFWLGRSSYTTVTGKGDSGQHVMMPRRVRWPVYAGCSLWVMLTLVIYTMIAFGGIVHTWGLDHSFTLRHYATAFGIEYGEFGLQWTGSAWNSLWTTVTIAGVAAPLTAGFGLLTAYLLARQQFAGKNVFEFGTMLSFAIPGTVIGVSYILAFNVPPFELTGTGVILVLCFVFRNMPVGVRAGLAAMSQIDRSLDEASLTLGARSSYSIRKVILPLIRPAILGALVYSFVRAMTAISAVIFLVSAEYDMATSYIIGRVENNDYGIAIAYSTVMIFVMLAAVLLLQLLVGERRIRSKRQIPAMVPAGET
ncbi:MAG: iron ABC transporter permease [Gammaproteobacteria bacterium]|nr:iron ABC transporter permease [Gammaproteobacteria bacterium]